MAATAATVTLQIVNPPAVLGKRARGLDTMEVDYSKPLAYPPSAEVVEAMRLRILQLENELRAAKKQKTTHQSTLPFAGPSASTSAPVASTSSAPDAKASAKLIKARTKSLFDQLKKAAKAEKYQNVVRTVKVEEHFSFADFDVVFNGADRGGALIQPTPSNKPKSSVWIRRYSGEADLQTLFGDAYKRDQLKGWQWTIGGIHQGKSTKLGQVQLRVQSLEVQWSKNTEKAVLKAEISEENMGSTFLGHRSGGRGGFWSLYAGEDDDW